MKIIFIATLICLLNSYTHAADFPTGDYICNRIENNHKLTTKISIEEIHVGTMSLPLVQGKVISSDHVYFQYVPKLLNGIASISKFSKNYGHLDIGPITFAYDLKKLPGSVDYGECEQLNQP